MSKNKKMRVVFVEDDDLLAEALMEWSKDHNVRAWIAKDAMEANKIVADYYIFDLSAIGALYSVHQCYSPICTLACNHPGAIMGVLTAWPEKHIAEVLDRVKEETGQRPVYIQTGRDCLENLEAKILGD